MSTKIFLVICIFIFETGCFIQATAAQHDTAVDHSDNLSFYRPDSFDLPTTVGTILFRSDSAQINQALWPVLGGVSKLAIAHPNLIITLEGHCDVLGSRNHNRQLSSARIRAVADFLIRRGIVAERIRRRPYGESRAAINIRDGGGRVFDRRVTISLSRGAGS